MLFSSLSLAIAFATAAAPPPSGQPLPLRYHGLCEASAAAVIGPNRFAVASDDSKTIRIYERGRPDPVGSPVDMGDAEDLEGAAAFGDRIFWVTSHSLTKKGKDKPERKQLVETSITGGTLVVGERFRDLQARITALLEVPKWPLEVSLNIEGMAASPEGDLLIGLRAPLNGKKAAVAVIPNPLARPRPGAAAPRLSWLDLDMRGVRSIERVGTGARAYLIVAGPTGEGDPDWALFWWDGANATEPGPAIVFEDRLPASPGLISRDIVPEAAIRWEDGTIEIFGDNEANCKEGKPGAWFPSIEIQPGQAR